jgi:tetratricopeptide (TPR) repeat protein
VGEFGGERGWKTDIIIIATIVGLISVAMFWYYETVRMEDVKEQRNDALEQMLKHHNDLIANFTDVAMAVLRIAEPHQMKILDETTCQQAIPCAAYINIIKKMRQDLEAADVDEVDDNEVNLAFSYLAARVLIYAGKAEGKFERYENLIEYYLDEHEKQAIDKNVQFIRWNKNLRGSFLTEKALLINKSSVQPKLDKWEEAISWYQQAIDASYQYNDPEYVFDPPFSAILSIREDQFVTTRRRFYLSDIIKRSENESKNMKPLTDVLDNIGPVLGRLNLAEVYIMKGEFNKAQGILNSTRVWSENHLDTLVQMSVQDDPKKLFNGISALWVYCEARKRFRTGETITRGL